MSYVKTITYADNLEIYEYEKRPLPHRIGVRDPDKEKPTEEEKFENREKNQKHAQRNFRKLVGANLVGEEKPLFISFTYAENVQDINVAYDDYGSFIYALKYKFGKNLKYIVVPEFQRRGAIHFHAFFWGLPINAKQERKERIVAKIWGHGFVDVMETDGSQKLAGYLAKYMAKAFINKNLKNKKSYESSRNIIRPNVEKDTIASYALWQYVGANDLPIIETRYNTQWLGKGHFRLFKITQNNPF